LAENSSDRAERRIWKPEVVDEQTATLRARGPGHDAAATALAAALVDLAEQAIHDRSAAEAIVDDIVRSEAALVTIASRAVTPSQGEAAEATLARMVRRAVLDALPPVVATTPPALKAGRQSSGAAPSSRKLRPVKGKAAAAGTPVAPGGRRTRRLVLAALLVLVLAGFAAWQLLPSDGPELAALSTEPALDTPDVSTMTLPEALQLEAVEPGGGPLRDMARRPDFALAAAGAAGAGAASGAASAAVGGSGAEAQALPTAETAPVPATGALPIEGSGLRVFILYPAGEPAAAEAGALYAALSGTGQVPLVVLRDVSFPVGAARIRYYHADDAAAAGALAEFLDAPNGGWTVQDFGHVRPLPVPGTLEIYVPSAL
jgi:hypothetical protein